MLSLYSSSDFQVTLDQLAEKTELSQLSNRAWNFESDALSGSVIYGPKKNGYGFRLWNYRVKEDVELKRHYSRSSDWYLNIVVGSAGIESSSGEVSILSGALANSEFHNLKMDNTFTIKAPGEIISCSYYIDRVYLEQYLNDQLERVRSILDSTDSMAFYELLTAQTQEMMRSCFPGDWTNLFFEDLVGTRVHHMLLTNLEVFWKRMSTSEAFDVNNQQVQNMLKVNTLFGDYHNPPTIREISEFVGMNEVAAQELFKQIYGKTPYQFFNESRLAEAHRLILDSPHRISEIGAMLGFASMSHFSKAFKKAYNVLPKQLQLQRQRLN